MGTDGAGGAWCISVVLLACLRFYIHSRPAGFGDSRCGGLAGLAAAVRPTRATGNVCTTYSRSVKGVTGCFLRCRERRWGRGSVNGAGQDLVMVWS